MNRYSNIILTVAFIVVSTATVFAQQAQSANPAPAQTANVLSTELKQLYTIVKNNLTKLAEKMPEEH